MLPAFIEALMPIVSENVREIDAIIYDLLGRAEMKVPTAYFYHCLWLILMRSQNSRYGIIKYLFFKFEKIKKKSELKNSEMNKVRLSTNKLIIRNSE